MLERLIGAPPGLPVRDPRHACRRPRRKSVADPEILAWAKKGDRLSLTATPDQAAHVLADQAAFFAKWKKYLV